MSRITDTKHFTFYNKVFNILLIHSRCKDSLPCSNLSLNKTLNQAINDAKERKSG